MKVGSYYWAQFSDGHFEPVKLVSTPSKVELFGCEREVDLAEINAALKAEIPTPEEDIEDFCNRLANSEPTETLMEQFLKRLSQTPSDSYDLRSLLRVLDTWYP